MSAKSAHLGDGHIGWQALGPAVACTIFATSIVATRWYSRQRVVRCVGLDDYVILLSLALSWSMTAIIAVEINEGDDDYRGPVSPSTCARLVVICNILWILIVNITKASILVQYLRIFTCRKTRLICVSLMIALIPVVCWAIFGGTFLCSPTAKLWRPELPGHCMNAQTYWLSVAGTDIGLDFLILLLPLPAITSLHLPRKEKIGLVLVFLLGFFVCAVSVVRVLTVTITSTEKNYLASGIWAIIWSAVEANVGIVCACLLALKPLITMLFPKLLEDDRPPRHSMRLPMIECDETWQPWNAKTALTYPPRSASGPTAPGTSDSKQSSMWKISSTSGVGSVPPLSEVENIDVIEPESPLRLSRSRRQEQMSLFDVLQEDEREARSRFLRRNSCFTEHI